MTLRFFCSLLAMAASNLSSAREHVALLGTYTDTGSRGIYVVRVDGDTGDLTKPTLVAELPDPEFLALHPNGRIVYALTQVSDAEGKRVGAVAAFKLDPKSAQLTHLNTQATDRGSLCHLAVDAKGRMLVAASYGGAHVVSFPLDADGRVGATKTVIEHEGPLGPSRARQDRPHPHSVTISPDNRFAFVADLSLDRVFAYKLGAEDGSLVAHEPAYLTVQPGAGPRHTKFSPDGKSFYVLNELNNTVTACSYDVSRGAAEPLSAVSTLPDDFEGKSTSSEVRVHPSGRFVYTANRGFDSIAVFARNPESGELTRVEIVPSGGETPRNFALSPDGEWLLCAHQRSNNLTLFKVDSETGRLTRAPQSVEVPKAVCVLFLP